MTVFNDEEETIFVDNQRELVDTDKVSASLEAIAESGDTVVLPQSYDERMKSGMQAETSRIALDQKAKEDDRLGQDAMRAISDGEPELSLELSQQYHQQSAQQPTKEHFTRGVLNILGDNPIVNKSFNAEELDEEGSEAMARLLNKQQLQFQKYAYWQSRIAALQARLDDTSWVNQGTDYLYSFTVPLQEYLNTRGLGDDTFFENSLSLPNTVLRQQHDELFMQEEDLESFKRRADEWLQTNVDESGNISDNLLAVIQTASDVAGVEDADYNSLLALDAGLTFLPMLKYGSKASFRSLTKSTNTSKASEITSEALKDFGDGAESVYTNVHDDVDDAINDALPQELKPDLRNNPTFGAIHERFADNVADFQNTINNSKVLTLNAEELQQAQSNITKRLESQILKGNRKPIDTGYVTGESGGLAEYYAILGRKGTTQGYTTPKGAEVGAQRLGLEPADFDVIGKDDGFFIRYKEKISPDKYTNEIEVGKAQLVTPVGEVFKSASSYLDTLSDEYLRSYFKGNKLRNSIEAEAKKIPTLSSQEKDVLSKALRYNQKQDAWFSDKAEFISYLQRNNVEFKPKMWEAYTQLQKVSDMDYMLRNDALRENLATKGYQTLDVSKTRLAEHFNGGKVTGKSIDVEDLSDTIVYDLQNSRVFKKGELSTEEWAKLKDKNWQAYTLAPKDVGKDFGGAAVFISPKGVITRNELEFFQLGYRPGGHRIYKDNLYVVQQASRITNSDGSTLMFRPATRSMFSDVRKAQDYSDKMERVRKVLLDLDNGGDVVTAQNRYERIGLNRDFAEVRNAFARGDFNINEKFEYARRGEDIETVSQMRTSNASIDRYDDLGGEMADLIDTGYMYYSKRGTHLTDLDGNDLDILDPITALDNSLSQAVNATTVQSFGQRAMRQWVKRFHKFDKVPTNKTLNELFDTSIDNLPINNSADKRAAELSRNAIKRWLNRENTFDRKIKGLIKDVNLNLHEAFPRVPANLFEGSVLSANPIGFMRGLNFHITLGLLTPHNFMVQAQQALIVASSAGPQNTMRYLSRGIYLSNAGRNPNTSIHKFFANRIAKSFGDEGSKLTRMLDEYTESGFNNIDDSVAYIDQGTPSGVLSLNAFRKGGSKALDIGRLPFDMTERFNRGTAFARAWDELGYDNISRKLTEEERIQLTGLTNKYALDMISSRQSAFQQGFLALPTQFYSYFVRLYEALMPAAVGGSARFSTKEKLGIWASMFALYGSDALPTFGLYEGTSTALFGADSEAKKVMDKGLLDSMFYIAGADTDIGRRVGAVGAIQDVLDRTVGQDATLMETVFGASAGISYPLLRGYVHSAAIALEGGVFDSDALTRAWLHGANVTAEQVTTLRNIMKASQAYDEGFARTRFGDKAFPVTQVEALLLPLGISPEAQFVIQDKFKELKDINSKGRGEAAKRIKYYIFESLREEDPEKAKQYMANAKFFLDFVDIPKASKDELLRKSKRVNDYWNKTLLDHMAATGDIKGTREIMETYGE